MVASRKRSNAPADNTAGAPAAAHHADNFNGHAARPPAPVYPPEPPAPKLIARCKTCHGEDVLLDAWASWSFERQAWVLGHTFDHAFCATCETECQIECVPVETRSV